MERLHLDDDEVSRTVMGGLITLIVEMYVIYASSKNFLKML